MSTLLTSLCFLFFFFNDTATTEIYTLSLHDALPISVDRPWSQYFCCTVAARKEFVQRNPVATKRAVRAILKDRKSTRLNSSHGYISYAVFCLKKKKKKEKHNAQEAVDASLA